MMAATNLPFELRTALTQEYAALVSIVANWKLTHGLLPPFAVKQCTDITVRCAELHGMLFK